MDWVNTPCTRSSPNQHRTVAELEHKEDEMLVDSSLSTDDVVTWIGTGTSVDFSGDEDEGPIHNLPLPIGPGAPWLDFFFLTRLGSL